ncbi:hypothetical protein SAMN05444672_14814 [Bacillus sp. OK838]|nr:hypothetical protein SAMN05444672_14814 [Bacillus sp. OK838]
MIFSISVSIIISIKNKFGYGKKKWFFQKEKPLFHRTMDLTLFNHVYQFS